MNPFIQQQVENMVDEVELFVKGCDKAARGPEVLVFFRTDGKADGTVIQYSSILE